MERIVRHPDEWIEEIGKLSSSYSYRRFTEQLARARGTLPLSAEAIIEDRFAGRAEPHRIYELFFSDEAVESWRTLFAFHSPPPYKVQYDAVFVHQKPSVRFPVGGQRGCELGDALVLLIDAFDQRMYAQFLQAKMFDEWPPSTVGKQWELYTRWPEFEYTPAKGRKEVRNLRFPGPVGCAKFLLLDAQDKRVWLAPAALGLPALTMSEQVTNYFSGLDARPVAWDRTTCKSDWDHLIHDLIEHTAASPLPKRQVGGVAGTRGTWAGRHFLHGQDPSVDTDESQWGIPIIIIEAGIAPQG